MFLPFLSLRSLPIHSTGELLLYSNDLTGTIIPDEFYRNTRMERLDLDANRMLQGTLSPSIGNLRDLITLSLFLTSLSGTLPSELGLLSSLKVGKFQLTQVTGRVDICGARSLWADCFPLDNPSTECPCCNACCDRALGVCSDVKR